jgi:teichuronic acid biosynthesis glycosyltransferase TuaC
MKILIISWNYPSANNPTKGTFVHETVKGFKKKGNEVLVISPKVFFKEQTEPLVESFEGVNILHPKYISFSNKIIFGKISTIFLGEWNSVRAIYRCLPIIKDFNPDFCYAHFLFHSGYVANIISKKLGIKYFLSLGESSFDKYHYRSNTKILNTLKSADKIFTVSNAIKNELNDLWSINSDKIVHIPNGIDLSKFYRLEKRIAKEKIGLKNNKPTVIFVGHFIERKGPDRILRAIVNNNIDVNIIFAGSGSIELNDKRIFFKGKIFHDQLVFYLNAADIFILPTLAEGMPNAIIEAMACGLPIISSDLGFNHEFLNNKCSILVDPQDINTLGLKINEILKDKNRLFNMSKESTRLSKQYSLDHRVDKILNLFK